MVGFYDLILVLIIRFKNNEHCLKMTYFMLFGEKSTILRFNPNICSLLKAQFVDNIFKQNMNKVFELNIVP